MIPEKIIKLKKKYIFYRTLSIILCTLLLCSAVLCAFVAVRDKSPSLPEDSIGIDTSTDPTTPPESTSDPEDDRVAALESQLAAYEDKIVSLESLSVEY